MSVAKELAALFRRDLSRLIQQIEAYPNDEMVWHTHPAITSGETLCCTSKAICGIHWPPARQDSPHSRRRELEFSSKGILREELVRRVAELKVSIPSIIEGGLSPEQFEMEYPEIVLQCATSTREFLIHLSRTSELAHGRDGLFASDS
jgi:hypothetical protein